MNKKEILSTLKSEIKETGSKEKYHRIILIVTMKRIDKNTGFVSGEFYQDDKMNYRGAVILPINQNLKIENSVWASMKVGSKNIYGFLLDSRNKTWLETVADFFKRSIEEGRVQDFIPFSSRK